jgi:polyvinyl alcohol dehydrogenase (cytochrome)
MMSADALLKVMEEGAMRRQAVHLTGQERRAIAAYLSESSSSEPQPVWYCDSGEIDMENSLRSWGDWGGGLSNYRNEASTTINRRTVNDLTLKWAFSYPGATRARSQPLVYADTVFVGSQDGTVYALDLSSGCARWTYSAGAEVRNGLALVDSLAEPLLVFGDFSARVHAIETATGKQVWTTDVASHPDATITGSVKVAEGKVFVPISSSEWATAADPGYPCCSFRGGVAALDAKTGTLQWNTYVIPEVPVATGTKNAAGVDQYGPSGAPVWNSPAIDIARGLLYVGTGEAYTSPASSSSDAVIAMRLDDGQIVWRKQLLAGDAWNMACFIGGGANCPEENGPDLDIGASIILWQSERQSRLLVGQKSGDVYALDPDHQGAVRWHRKLGRGGFAGGVHWGMTFDGTTLFVPIADTDFLGLASGEAFPGVHALDPDTGLTRWYTRADDECLAETKPACDPGMSAAASSSSDLVFAGGFDGMLRAYDSASGEVLWRFNTAQSFGAVNGDTALGGSIESDGPVLVGDHLLINSGYQFGGRLPGNALLVFSRVTEALDDEGRSGE